MEIVSRRFWQRAKRSKNSCNTPRRRRFSAISSCDALTAKLLGCRHRGENHIGVVDLLKKLPLQNKTELNNRIRQVKEILMRKTQAEYESKPMRKADAETMLIQSSRTYKWAKDLIES
jgi:hypothetical protein